MKPFPTNSIFVADDFDNSKAKIGKMSIHERIVFDRVEIIVTKGKIAHIEQFLLLTLFFTKVV